MNIIKENTIMLIFLFFGIFCFWGVNTDFFLRWNEANPNLNILPIYFILLGGISLFLSAIFFVKGYSIKTLGLSVVSYLSLVSFFSFINSCNTIFLNLLASIYSFNVAMESEEVNIKQAYFWAVLVLFLFNLILFLSFVMLAKIYFNKKKKRGSSNKNM